MLDKEECERCGNSFEKLYFMNLCEECYEELYEDGNIDEGYPNFSNYGDD
jgi:protein-arginine kinase activator protein McsA